MAKNHAAGLPKMPGMPMIGLSVLLGGALLWAYLITHPFGETSTAGAVQVWREEASNLIKLTLHDKNVEVVVEPEWGDPGDSPYIWIRSEETRRVPPKRKKNANRQPETREKTTVREFKGNKKAVKLIYEFAELRAVRAIGGLDTLDKAAFGLDKPGGMVRLEIAGEEKPFELALGAKTYGKKMRYALFREDETVYLFRQSLFNSLTRARTNLMDRALFAFPAGKAARVRVVYEGTTREIYKRLGAELGEPGWGEGPDDPEGDPAMGAFVAALNRLRVAEYLVGQIPPATKNPFPVLEVRLFRDGDEPEKGAGSKDAPAANNWLKLFPAEKGEMIAQSSHTKKWVRLGTRAAKGLVRAAGKMMGKQPRDESVPGQKG